MANPRASAVGANRLLRREMVADQFIEVIR